MMFFNLEWNCTFHLVLLRYLIFSRRDLCKSGRTILREVSRERKRDRGKMRHQDQRKVKRQFGGIVLSLRRGNKKKKKNTVCANTRENGLPVFFQCRTIHWPS